MAEVDLLAASCRVAFAAFTHDIGKLAERARLPVAKQRIDDHKHLYCPFNKQHGYFSHVHAAYTALAIDAIESHLPPLTGHSLYPFADWGSKEADDSLINAAAMHHKPTTFLQWVIATADRVASGFERDEFERYNHAQEESHYRSRLLTLFGQIDLHAGPSKPADNTAFRYPLRPLSIEALFPGNERATVPASNEAAQREYMALWQAFVAGLEQIPASHRHSMPLWLDHFDSLWHSIAQSVPSATAFGTRPDVSLYDHSKTTAALATALWRYQHESNQNDPRPLANREDWNQQKLLLIQGDFFGIQNFIFSAGSQTNKRAAKLLRGRSFYVSLLTECAAVRILEALELPSTSQITNAAGKFMILAPNTPATLEKLSRLQHEFDNWFLDHTYGQSGIGIAWEPACCNDFLAGNNADSPFKALVKKLFAANERAKYGRYQLCGEGYAKPVFARYLDSIDTALGVCAVDQRQPASRYLEGGNTQGISELAHDHIQLGKYLADPACQRLLLSQQPIHRTLTLPVFGYYINFSGPEDVSGKFGELVRQRTLKRAFDISLPGADASVPLFHGYAQRFINAYVPVSKQEHEGQAQCEWEQGKYARNEAPQAGEIKTFEHLACEDRRMENGGFVGIAALHTLKGDVDNLGQIFEAGLQRPTFAKMAALSRQMNLFFAAYLPHLCASRYPDCYTVFAGGDDFFLVGPWHSTLKLAAECRCEFTRYVANNPQLHFSAGLLQTKPGLPIRYLAEQGEAALEAAKSMPEKDSVTVFGQTVSWQALSELLDISAILSELRQQLRLFTGYLYGLIELCEMAGRADIEPSAARWRAYLAYRTSRMVGDKLAKKPGESKADYDRRCQRLTNELLCMLGNAITAHKEHFKIAIFSHLYQLRD